MAVFGKQTSVGVSISDSSIEMIEIRAGKRGVFDAVALSERALEPGIVEHGKVVDVDRLADALKKAHEEAEPNGCSGRTIHVALPDSVTYFHMFRFPGLLSDAEVNNALVFQAEEVIPFVAEDLAVDFRIASRSTEETVVLYAVTPWNAVRQYALSVRRAGFTLGMLGLEADALSRALLSEPRKGKASLVADIGHRTTTIFVRDASGLRATFSRPLAGAIMTEAVAGAKKITLEKAEALKRKVGVKEGGDATVRQALVKKVNDLGHSIGEVADWYARVLPETVLDEVAVTGGTSEMPGLVGVLQSVLSADRTGFTVRQADPFVRVAATALVKKVRAAHKAALFAPALGMALLGLHPDQAFTFSDSSRRTTVRLPRQKELKKAGTKAGATFAGVPPKTRLMLAGAFLILSFIALSAALWYRVQTQHRIDAEIQVIAERRAGTAESSLFEQRVVIVVSPVVGDVIGRIVVEPYTEQIEIETAQTVTRDGVATGIVTLVNESSVAQPLVATTRLRSEAGTIFRLREAVTVPPNGSVDAEVYADQPGTSGNIDPSHFTIPGLPTSRQSVVNATSASPMTGGVVMYKVVSEADIAAAIEALRVRVSKKATILVQGLIADGEKTLSELTRVTRVSAESSAAVGEEVETATVTGVFKIESLVFVDVQLLDFLLAQEAARRQKDRDQLRSSGEIRYSEVVLVSLADDMSRVELLLQSGYYPHEAR